MLPLLSGDPAGSEMLLTIVREPADVSKSLTDCVAGRSAGSPKAGRSKEPRSSADRWCRAALGVGDTCSVVMFRKPMRDASQESAQYLLHRCRTASISSSSVESFPCAKPSALSISHVLTRQRVAMSTSLPVISYSSFGVKSSLLRYPDLPERCGEIWLTSRRLNETLLLPALVSFFHKVLPGSNPAMRQLARGVLSIGVTRSAVTDHCPYSGCKPLEPSQSLLL